MRLQVEIAPRHAPGILAGLVEANLLQIREAGQAGRFVVLDGLRTGTVRYVQADPNEVWKPWDMILRDGWGDCEDLVPAVTAEYLAAGIFARPVAYQPNGPGTELWHVVVQVQDPKTGRFWYGDPSVLGGMGGVG